MQLQNDPQAVPEDADATTVSEPDQETTAAPAEREAKRQRRPETKMTLRGILTDAGLEKFVPPANDSEFHVLSRVRGRCSHLRKFTEEIRVHGRVVRKPNVHNQMEHEFAKDCAAFQCSAEKQTRQMLWQRFTERCSQMARGEEGNVPPLHNGAGGAQPLVHVGRTLRSVGCA